MKRHNHKGDIIMAETLKTESEVYKELYEKQKKENERLKSQAIKSQANKTVITPRTTKSIEPIINPNNELIAVKNDIEALKQALTATIQQLNVYGAEQEKIRSQVRANYKNISDIVSIINGGK